MNRVFEACKEHSKNPPGQTSESPRAWKPERFTAVAHAVEMVYSGAVASPPKLKPKRKLDILFQENA